MIVPSRSIKTPADNSLATFGILSKTGHQFLSCHGWRSQLTYDDRARVVGDFCSFGRGRSAGETECKESDGRIARPRDVETLSRLRGDIVRCSLLLEKHHALFAQSAKDIFCFPFFKKRFASALQIQILGRSGFRIAAGNTRSEKSLSAVWLDHCQAAPLDQVAGIRIRSHDLPRRARSFCDLRNQAGR